MYRLLLPLLLSLSACERAPIPAPAASAAPARSPADHVDVPGLKAALDGGQVPLLLDVRTPLEFRQGHVPGAINLPLDELDGRLAELQPYQDRPIYLICRTGARSSQAAQVLAEAGLQPVNVVGGTATWIRAGYSLD